MSLMAAERERFRRDFDRANSRGWAEEKRRQVQAIQTANPTWTFQRSWDHAERQQQTPAPEPTTISDWAKVIKASNPTLSFEESWRRAESAHPELVTSSTPEESRVAAKLALQQEREKWRAQARVEAEARELMARDPRLPFGVALIRARGETPEDPKLEDTRDKLEQEKERHRQMGAGQTAEEIEKHTKVLALARKLMSRDTSLTIDMAMQRIYRENPSLVPTKPGTTTSARFAGSYLVTAQLATQFDGLPTTIQYMPAGRSTITPNVDGKPKEITVNVTPTTAAALQGDLARLLSGNVRPFVDFDHAGGAAAALPKRFFWKEGEGVMLELDWTGAGKNAIGGRDYSYLSPTFMLSKDGDAINLPSSGAIASLVNDPAFRTIRRIHV